MRYRETISAIPAFCALWGFWCHTPSPFSERFPLGEHTKWRRDTWVRYPPLRYYLERYFAIWGGISHWATKEVARVTGSMRAPSCESWRSLAKFRELWRTHHAIFTRTSLTFTRLPAKVPHIHQSSGEGTFCMWVSFLLGPNWGLFLYQRVPH